MTVSMVTIIFALPLPPCPSVTSTWTLCCPSASTVPLLNEKLPIASEVVTATTTPSMRSETVNPGSVEPTNCGVVTLVILSFFTPESLPSSSLRATSIGFTSMGVSSDSDELEELDELDE